MAKVKLTGFANINVGSNPGNIRAYAGVAGDVLDVPEDVARPRGPWSRRRGR
jgi:hypothetical protein